MTTSAATAAGNPSPPFTMRDRNHLNLKVKICSYLDPFWTLRTVSQVSNNFQRFAVEGIFFQIHEQRNNFIASGVKDTGLSQWNSKKSISQNTRELRDFFHFLDYYLLYITSSPGFSSPLDFFSLSNIALSFLCIDDYLGKKGILPRLFSPDYYQYKIVKCELTKFQNGSFDEFFCASLAKVDSSAKKAFDNMNQVTAKLNLTSKYRTLSLGGVVVPTWQREQLPKLQSLSIPKEHLTAEELPSEMSKLPLDDQTYLNALSVIANKSSAPVPLHVIERAHQAELIQKIPNEELQKLWDRAFSADLIHPRVIAILLKDPRIGSDQIKSAAKRLWENERGSSANLYLRLYFLLHTQKLSATDIKAISAKAHEVLFMRSQFEQHDPLFQMLDDYIQTAANSATATATSASSSAASTSSSASASNSRKRKEPHAQTHSAATPNYSTEAATAAANASSSSTDEKDPKKRK